MSWPFFFYTFYPSLNILWNWFFYRDGRFPAWSLKSSNRVETFRDREPDKTLMISFSIGAPSIRGLLGRNGRVWSAFRYAFHIITHDIFEATRRFWAPHVKSTHKKASNYYFGPNVNVMWCLQNIFGRRGAWKKSLNLEMSNGFQSGSRSLHEIASEL